ncbi:MAG TPA: hypothetical protein PLM93_10820, partial [Sulfuricurvum sp.]|nr:hypothetical protein [Sulfuricurvum sp.]HQT37711.1 hypothetical protein [Sulfuricurvum sp.]
KSVRMFTAFGVRMLRHTQGAYFTIRYRPYCTLKSPEREIAMELHRKKLMNEKMSVVEVKKNTLYKKNTQMNNYF